MGRIRGSLQTIEKAIEGLVLMSGAQEEAFQSIAVNMVSSSPTNTPLKFSNLSHTIQLHDYPLTQFVNYSVLLQFAQIVTLTQCEGSFRHYLQSALVSGG